MTQISGVAILEIVKGVDKVPGDTDSGEVGLDPLNLLDPAGFSCTDYQMMTPELKSSTAYADSPLSDGRTLMSGAVGNVNETIRAEINAGTIIQLAALLSKLGEFKHDCLDYWSAFHQIEPVYLKNQVVGEPGPRFALLYHLDYVIDVPLLPSDPHRTITISIEREPYWRGIAPGDNPKKWTFNNFFHRPFNSGVADISGAAINGTNLVELGSVNNRLDYQTTDKQLYKASNFIDIPGTSIPGDAPALICLTVKDSNVSTTPANKQLFIGRFTPKRTAIRTASASTFFAQALSFNAADMTAVTNATIEADTGAPTRQSNGTASRGKFTPADNNAAIRFTVANRLINNHRGRFAAFLRARQHSGAQNDLTMWLVYGQSIPVYQQVTLPSVNPIRQDGTGNTSFWPMTYMGVIEFPVTGKSSVSQIGLGENGSNADLTLQIWSQRVAGTTAVLYYSDVVLIPLDEPSGYFQSPVTNVDTRYIFDNTGYYQHGSTEPFAAINVAASAGSEYRGQDLYLTPGVDQRLYFFTMFADNTSSVADWFLSVFLNIVPRWVGLRDV